MFQRSLRGRTSYEVSNDHGAKGPSNNQTERGTEMPAQLTGNYLSKPKLDRIAERANRDPNAIYTSIIHALDITLLRQCFHDLCENKAMGIDGVDKSAYRSNLEQNLAELMARIRKRTYVPKAARIVEIPKVDGTKRPLAISCLEDKIVQEAMKRILEAIYEPLFLESSHGYRPGRGCDTALVALNKNLNKFGCGVVIDIDLKSFFNSIPHDKLLALIGLKIKQPHFIWLLTKLLRTPYVENGVIKPNLLGVPQGAIISPILSNIYLHFALDRWFEQGIKQDNQFEHATSIRYADDAIYTFGNLQQADLFMVLLKRRLERFDIELNISKTKQITFSRKNAEAMAKNGKKAETFTFLGFVHYWKKSRNRKTGEVFWRTAVKSCSKRMTKKLNEMNEYIRSNRHDENLMNRTIQVVKGIAAYYCVNDNITSVQRFNYQVERSLFKWLNRRSQKGTFSWMKFQSFLAQHNYPRAFKVKNLFYNVNSSMRI